MDIPNLVDAFKNHPTAIVAHFGLFAQAEVSMARREALVRLGLLAIRGIPLEEQILMRRGGSDTRGVQMVDRGRCRALTEDCEQLRLLSGAGCLIEEGGEDSLNHLVAILKVKIPLVNHAPSYVTSASLFQRPLSHSNPTSDLSSRRSPITSRPYDSGS